MHHSDVCVEETIAQENSEQNILEWLSELFHEDLGEGHLEEYMAASSESLTLDLHVWPQDLYVNDLEIATSILSKNQPFAKCTLVHAEPSYAVYLFSDSPLRAPPSRA